MSKDHCLMSSLSVSAFQTRATGASKVRSTTSGSSFTARLLFAAISLLLALIFLRLVLALQLPEVAAQPVEALLPVPPIVLDPLGDALERIRPEPAGSPLRLAAALDQARALENLEVLGHGGQAHVERLGQFQDRGFPRGEAREDRAPRGIGEGGKGRAEAIGQHGDQIVPVFNLKVKYNRPPLSSGSNECQVFSRYPVLKIHATTASETARNTPVMARLRPTLT